MVKNPDLKIYAFIDSQNLNLSIRDQGWKLDFGKFRKYLKAKFNIEKAYLFVGYIRGNEKLYVKLQEEGYILIFKPTLEYKKNNIIFTKGNVDAELVLHSMIQYQNYDKAIIVSNDGDFHCLIEYLDNENKLLRLIIPNKNKYSSLLRKFSKKMLFLNTFKERLGIVRK
jgi:uncharacterized LabA/DUF88 family protein